MALTIRSESFQYILMWNNHQTFQSMCSNIQNTTQMLSVHTALSFSLDTYSNANSQTSGQYDYIPKDETNLEVI